MYLKWDFDLSDRANRADRGRKKGNLYLVSQVEGQTRYPTRMYIESDKDQRFRDEPQREAARQIHSLYIKTYVLYGNQDRPDCRPATAGDFNPPKTPMSPFQCLFNQIS
jgi:hypothetical protein